MDLQERILERNRMEVISLMGLATMGIRENAMIFRTGMATL